MSYAKLADHFARYGRMQEIAEIIEWDQAVTMPLSAGPTRALCIAELATTMQDLLQDPRLGDWLAEADQLDELDDWQRSNLVEMERLHRKALAVPPSLVARATRAQETSKQAWRRYRSENDFSSYEPFLHEVVEANREIAGLLATELGTTPYEALADHYEPGICEADIDAVFGPLEDVLPSFAEKVIDRQKQNPLTEFEGPFPIDRQRDLGRAVLDACGIDGSKTRLDVSAHPFCGGVPGDVRITTRFDEGDFLSSLMAVVHECGHGKYEHGLPRAWVHQPVGRARGMVLHEGQSLLHEMQVGRSRAFLSFLLPHLRATFEDCIAARPDAFELENLVRHSTRVERGFIRVHADEVTYPLHVLIRYGIEKDLIAGKLSVRDLPEAWDAAMSRHLNLRTRGNDRDGCMQDIHWPMGAFGYFPLYTLGALCAAQLFQAARDRIPDLDDQVSKGSFDALDDFLRGAVWSWGSRFSTNELLERATGSPLSAGAFLAHLERRYDCPL